MIVSDLDLVQSLSPDQKQVFQHTKDYFLSKNIADTLYDDYKLLRFCQTKKFKLNDVKIMLDSEIKFRKEMEIDKILHYNNVSLNKLYEKGFIHGCSGVSKEGYPINIELCANALNNLIECVTLNDFSMFEYLGSEVLLSIRFPMCSRLAKRRIDKAITIYDVQDVKLSNCFNSYFRKLLSEPAAEIEKHYPDTLHQIWIINAPFTFSAAWSVVKLGFSDEVRNKIKVFSSNYQKALLKIADADQLPDFLGGTVKNFPNNKLPWTDYENYCMKKKTYFPL